MSKLKSVEVENFGDVVEMRYNDGSGNTEAVGVLNPVDVERLLLGIAEGYAGAKSARGRRIRDLAAELAKEYYRDSGLLVKTRALVAIGKTVTLGSPKLEIGDEPQRQTEKALKAFSKKVRGAREKKKTNAEG